MLRMPSKADLPPGPKREFATELMVHFREAGRPRLDRIATATSELPDAPSVSRETVRRLLTGQTLSSWEKVNAVLRALCQLCGQDPERRRWPADTSSWGGGEDDDTTCREYLFQLWNDAIDEVESGAVPPPRSRLEHGVPPAAAAAEEEDPSPWFAVPQQGVPPAGYDPQYDPQEETPSPSFPVPASAPFKEYEGGYVEEPPF
jgi:hypothetical protein